MIDHLGCWRRVLGKESKCEISKYLEPTAGKDRNPYLFHCSRWLAEGGQTRSGSQSIMMCEMSNWLTWGYERSINKKHGARDNQGEGIVQREIKMRLHVLMRLGKRPATSAYFIQFHNHKDVWLLPTIFTVLIDLKSRMIKNYGLYKCYSKSSMLEKW